MNFFASNKDFDHCLSHRSESTIDRLTQEMMQTFNLDEQLEALALWLAQAWKDQHLDTVTDPRKDLDACVLAVTTELAIAAKVVGGPVGLVILTGASSEAVRKGCWQVLQSEYNQVF
jgi:hypothetical protein